jgi:hypothetical protein
MVSIELIGRVVETRRDRMDHALHDWEFGGRVCLLLDAASGESLAEVVGPGREFRFGERCAGANAAAPC